MLQYVGRCVARPGQSYVPADGTVPSEAGSDMRSACIPLGSTCGLLLALNPVSRRVQFWLLGVSRWEKCIYSSG